MRTRRRPQEHPENHERWLVSYADLLTLLFAFFVVMFAASRADAGKARQVSASVNRALGQGPIARGITTAFGNAQAKNAGSPAGDLAGALEALETGLASDLAAGKLQISVETRGVVLSLREAAFFHAARADVAVDSYPVLEKIATTLRQIPNAVRLEGHSDALPIHNSRFRNNWELSSARSIAMLEVLTERLGLDARRFAIVGYADTAPVDSNDTEEGRSRNRRVDIAILHATSAAGP